MLWINYYLPARNAIQNTLIKITRYSFVLNGAHEWSIMAEETHDLVIRDSVGNLLQDGDNIIAIRDLKVRGSSQVIKVGTKIKNIRLLNPENHDDHDIDCKIPGFGPMRLKSEKVKKA